MLLAECQETKNYDCEMHRCAAWLSSPYGKRQKGLPWQEQSLESGETSSSVEKERGKRRVFPTLEWGGETLTTFIVELSCSTKKLSENQFCQ